ncbi:hypothetical protein LguiA_027933 [Lonicera macranthoides]
MSSSSLRSEDLEIKIKHLNPNISEFSSLPCLINGATGEIHTYADVELTASKVAAGLNKLGVKQGDTIMILLPNSPNFFFTFLGASYRGALLTMANPFFTPAEVVKQAKASTWWRASAIRGEAALMLAEQPSTTLPNLSRAIIIPTEDLSLE